MTSFGHRLKQARANKQLTQNEVAAKLGIDYTTISKYENDKSEPDNEILRELAGMYQVSLDWLITGQISDSKPSNKLFVDGAMEELTDEESAYLIDSLEMFRLLKAKREKDKMSFRPDKVTLTAEGGTEIPK
jgi:transcriptional regulator with XRE-family HTH domain